MSDLAAETNAKLDVLIRLVANGLCGDKTQREKISLLHSVGLKPKLIAELLGTTSNAVQVAVSRIRKAEKRKRSPKSGAGSVG